MASTMPRPAMRVASRRMAISRALLVPRSSSRIGSSLPMSARGALQNGDAVADARHHPRAAGGVFVRREDVGEDGLGGEREGKEEDKRHSTVSQIWPP